MNSREHVARLLPVFGGMLCVAGGMVSAGCRQTSSTTPVREPAQMPAKAMFTTLTGTEWTLTSIEGVPVRQTLGDKVRPPTIRIAEDGAVTGFGGVNRLAGKVEPELLKQGKLDLSRLISTKMAGPEPAMRIEGQFTRLLAESRTYAIGTAGALTFSDGTKTLLEFGPSAGQ